MIRSAQSAHLVNCVILTHHTACLAPPNVTILWMHCSEELLSLWALLGYARAQGRVAPLLRNGGSPPRLQKLSEQGNKGHIFKSFQKRKLMMEKYCNTE